MIGLYGKNHPGFRKSWKKMIYLKRRMQYVSRTQKIMPDSTTVVFQSFNGKTYGCSPKAIYEYMISHQSIVRHEQ